MFFCTGRIGEVNQEATSESITSRGLGFIDKFIELAKADGKMYGAVTQSPLAMGITTVDVLVKAAKGEAVQDVPTDGYWYNADNIEDASIAPNLYD